MNSIHDLETEISMFFGTVGTVAWVCLLVALVILAGRLVRAADAYVQSKQREDRLL